MHTQTVEPQLYRAAAAQPRIAAVRRRGDVSGTCGSVFAKRIRSCVAAFDLLGVGPALLLFSQSLRPAGAPPSRHAGAGRHHGAARAGGRSTACCRSARGWGSSRRSRSRWSDEPALRVRRTRRRQLTVERARRARCRDAARLPVTALRGRRSAAPWCPTPTSLFSSRAPPSSATSSRARREADAEAAEAARERSVDLTEVVEDDRQIVRRDADAAVGDGDLHHAVAAVAGSDADLARRR